MTGVGPTLWVEAEPVERVLAGLLRRRWHPQEAHLPAPAEGWDEAKWMALVELARQRGLAPFLWSSIKDGAPTPDFVRQALAAEYQANALRNTLILAELETLLNKMNEAGIKALVLKGAALAEAVYGNVALRPMRDLDILVAEGDVERAMGCLEQLGYRPPHPSLGGTSFSTAFGTELAVVHDRRAAAVELHWSLINSPFHKARLPLEWFWASARPFRSNGADAWMLGAEAQFIHLCAHLHLHHSGDEWLWQIDLVELLYRQLDLDWAQIMRRATECEVVLPLRATMPGLVERWGAPVPRRVLEGVAALRPSPAEERSFRLLTERGAAGRRFASDVRMLSGWSVRARFALANLFPPGAYMDSRYGIRHPILRPLYYPYRWSLGLAGLGSRPDRPQDAGRKDE